MRVMVVAALLVCCGALGQAPCAVGDRRAALTVPYVSGSPELNTDTAAAVWGTAAAAVMEKDCSKVLDYPALRTTVRGFWTDTHLYLLFACPYQRLNLFLPPQGSGDRDKLWDRDVVEMFLGADWENIRRYREFEIAPTGDRVDLAIDLGRNEYQESWDSGWETKARIDEAKHVWYAASRIPLKAVTAEKVAVGTRWRMNLYRIDGVGADSVRHFLCWQPTCVKDRDPNHVPEHFGTLVFGGEASQARADETVRVAAVQMNARTFDKKYNWAQAEKGIRRAAARGAQIVCTPEAAVQGYARVSLPEGAKEDDLPIMAERARILAAAEPIPGPATERFARLARELGVWIVFGMDENRGGKLFNSAVLMSPQGKIEGVYSKVHLQNWMVASGVNHGSDFPVWDITVGKVRLKTGIQICYDIQHPEATRELALGGAEIVFVPYCTTDFSRPLLVHLFQTRALENRVFVVRVNYGAPRNSGTSSIIDFEGATQDELDGAPDVLVGDLNLTALRKVRAEWNEVYGNANRRPDAYKRLTQPR